jgi:formylglycine-generating enzyme required for sulfatase activity
VTNAEFARFVEATNYVTTAETAPRPADYPNAVAAMLKPGSLVFIKPNRPVDHRDVRQWWQYIFGANWRHPEGPDSSIEHKADHPVLHISYEDARAYAEWAGKTLATEAEWEYAARGGLDGAKYAWGDRFNPEGRWMSNTWQGEFPWKNLRLDGYEGTSPVGAFPANGYGLYDMIGNVWEWTDDWYRPRHPNEPEKTCCIPSNPRGGKRSESMDPAQNTDPIPRKVLKGGSHLCAPNYCRRYRPAARHPEQIDSAASNIGFRCVMRVDPEASPGQCADET